MRVAFLVTHLLGTGHLARALTLGRAFSAAGHEAHVVSGGMPVPNLPTDGVTLHQLAPVSSDGVDFSRLLDSQGMPVDEAYLTRRRADCLGALDALRPDVLVTELYPFGRRILKAEFLAVLNAAKAMIPRPRIYASIRDILAPPSKPSKAMEAEAILAAFYDGVLVHADPSITPLDLSWPVSPTLADRLRYTGFVAPPPPDPHPQQAGLGEVLVSAGGGGVGRRIFETAVKAAAGGRMPWRLLVGGADRAAQVTDLRQMAGKAPVIVEEARKDFRQMLRHAAVSVSMCGYNTAMDLLQTGCPGVLVPFDAGGEVEQTLRARSMARRDQFLVLPDADLTPATLSHAVAELADRGHSAVTGGFDGAAETVRIVEADR